MKTQEKCNLAKYFNYTGSKGMLSASLKRSSDGVVVGQVRNPNILLKRSIYVKYEQNLVGKGLKESKNIMMEYHYGSLLLEQTKKDEFWSMFSVSRNDCAEFEVHVQGIKFMLFFNYKDIMKNKSKGDSNIFEDVYLEGMNAKEMSILKVLKGKSDDFAFFVYNIKYYIQESFITFGSGSSSTAIPPLH